MLEQCTVRAAGSVALILNILVNGVALLLRNFKIYCYNNPRIVANQIKKNILLNNTKRNSLNLVHSKEYSRVVSWAGLFGSGSGSRLKKISGLIRA